MLITLARITLASITGMAVANIYSEETLRQFHPVDVLVPTRTIVETLKNLRMKPRPQTLDNLLPIHVRRYTSPWGTTNRMLRVKLNV